MFFGIAAFTAVDSCKGIRRLRRATQTTQHGPDAIGRLGMSGPRHRTADASVLSLFVESSRLSSRVNPDPSLPRGAPSLFRTTRTSYTMRQRFRTANSKSPVGVYRPMAETQPRTVGRKSYAAGRSGPTADPQGTAGNAPLDRG